MGERLIPISDEIEQLIIREMSNSQVNEVSSAHLQSFASHFAQIDIAEVAGVPEIHDPPHFRVGAELAPGSAHLPSVHKDVDCADAVEDRDGELRRQFQPIPAGWGRN